MLRARMFVCYNFMCCGGNSPCTEVISHSEESYWECDLIVCDLGTWTIRHPRPELVCSATEKIHHGIYKEGRCCISWTIWHMKVLEGIFIGKKKFIHIFSLILQNMIFLCGRSHRFLKLQNVCSIIGGHLVYYCSSCMRAQFVHLHNSVAPRSCLSKIIDVMCDHPASCFGKK